MNIKLSLSFFLLILLCLFGAAVGEESDVLRLPSALTAIEDQAFYRSDSIERVVLPENMHSIGAQAFAESSLREINLPASLESIASDAFDGCENLIATVEADSYAHDWCLKNDVAHWAIASLGEEQCKIVSGKGLTGELTVPSVLVSRTVVEIGANAFVGNDAITGLSLPDTLTAIGEYAFAYCANLTGNLTLPASLKTLGNGAFFNTCISGKIHIPNSVSSMGENVFANCSKLVIADFDCTVLPQGTFRNCTGLLAVWPEKNVQEICAQAFEGCSGIFEISWANATGLKTIGEGAFRGCTSLIRSSFPDYLTEIGKESFRGCTSLSEVTLGANVKSIRQGAFYGCTSLKTLILNSSLETIESLAFAECSALTGTINLPDTVSALADDAFLNCPASISQPESLISFEGFTVGASSTRAYVYANATAASSGSFSQTRLRIWDDSGALVTDTAKTSITTGSSRVVWFDLFSDADIYLDPDSRYTCQLYVVYNGATFRSTVHTFTTNSTLKVNAFLSASAMIANLENCSDTALLPSSKKAAMVAIAQTLLEDGYTPAFTAGVLANVRYEGAFGKFESSAYSSGQPTYLAYMDDLYDYRQKYSNKLVYNGISLSELSALMDKLAADNYTRGKFGLGSVQWTGARTKALVDLYVAEAGESDTINYDQTATAEMKMIKNDLSGTYKSVHTNWKNNNSANLYTDDAAYNAGYRFCVYYEVPASYRQKAITRGETARSIYKVMMGA